MSTYQEKQNEMIREDDEKYSDAEIIDDLQRCGYNIVTNRNYVTTEHLRFYAWLCRAALRKINEYQGIGVHAYWNPIFATDNKGIFQCSHCESPIMTHDVNENIFCRHCGAIMDSEILNTEEKHE